MNRFNILDIRVIISNIKRVFEFFKKYKQYNNFNKIILQFFNFNTKCPENIRDCEALRNEFLIEVENYKKYNVCSICDIQYVRLKFINRIKQLLKYE